LLDIVQKWKDKIIALVETKVRLMQLDFIERTSILMSNFIFLLVFILLGFGVFLFVGLGLAELFSELLASNILGYLTAASFYLLIGVLLYLLRKRMLTKLSNMFISILTEKCDDDEDDGDAQISSSDKKQA
jgi:uncharacterized membrane protein